MTIRTRRLIMAAVALAVIVAMTSVSTIGNAHGRKRSVKDWNISADATTSATTAAQASVAGDVLVAYVAADGPFGAGNTTATVSGCGLTWSLLARQNAQSGDSETWKATAAANNPSCQVTATATVAGYPITVTAADYGAVGAPVATTAHAATGAAQVTVANVPTGSALWLVGNDYDNAIARTWLAGDASVHQWLAPTGDTYWVEKATAAVSGTVTIGTSAPSTDEWNAVAVVIPPSAPSPTSSPSPTPTSTPGTCAPYPAFPDASCTGPTGVMANYSGPMNVTTPGAVIQNVVINTTGITVSANNVTFRNCKIIYSGTSKADYGLVEANPVTGTVFDHCEIDGKGLVKDGIHGGDNFTVTGCNIHDVGNGVEAGWAFTVKESYLWNIVSPAGYNWHADGIQAWDGTHDMLIDHNTVLMPAGEDGAVNFVGPTAQANNLVQHNLFAGGGYTVMVGSSTSNTNVQIINNHYSTRYFPKVGYYNIYYYGDGEVSGETVSGNVIDETGAAADHNI